MTGESLESLNQKKAMENGCAKDDDVLKKVVD